MIGRALQPVEKSRTTIAERREPPGLSASFRAKPGGLRRFDTFFNGL
jgi:hypothetical protein